MQRGWDILSGANDYFWIVILTIVGGSFGSSSITIYQRKMKYKKKLNFYCKEFKWLMAPKDIWSDLNSALEFCASDQNHL